MTTEKMIDQLRALIARCTDPEKKVYEALLDEAEGWKMRLEELDAEEADK